MQRTSWKCESNVCLNKHHAPSRLFVCSIHKLSIRTHMLLFPSLYPTRVHWQGYVYRALLTLLLFEVPHSRYWWFTVSVILLIAWGFHYQHIHVPCPNCLITDVRINTTWLGNWARNRNAVILHSAIDLDLGKKYSVTIKWRLFSPKGGRSYHAISRGCETTNTGYDLQSLT